MTDCKAGTLNFPSHDCLCTHLQITIYHQDVASSHVLFNFWAFGSSPAKNPGKAHSPPASPAPQLCLSYLSAFSGWLILCKDMECNLPHLATPGTYTRKNLKHNGDTLGPRQDLLWCRFIEQTVESYSEATAVEPRTKVTSRTD